MARKSIIDRGDPALQFISSAAEQQDNSEKAIRQTDESPRFKPAPGMIEVKSKRFQIVLQPSLYEAAKAEAEREGKSLNEFIHIALREKLGL